MTGLTADAVVVQGDRGRVSLPLATVQRIDRVGDSLLDGTAIGAAVGGGSALALMAKLCSEQQVLGHLGEPRSAFRGVRHARRGGRRRLDRPAIQRRKTVYRRGRSAVADDSPAKAGRSAEKRDPDFRSCRRSPAQRRRGIARRRGDGGRRRDRPDRAAVRRAGRLRSPHTKARVRAQPGFPRYRAGVHGQRAVFLPLDGSDPALCRLRPRLHRLRAAIGLSDLHARAGVPGPSRSSWKRSIPTLRDRVQGLPSAWTHACPDESPSSPI